MVGGGGGGRGDAGGRPWRFHLNLTHNIYFESDIFPNFILVQECKVSDFSFRLFYFDTCEFFFWSL